MKISGFQVTQSAASYMSPSKASTQATSVAARAASDVYSGERASRATDIMAGKDLRNISRNELKKLTNKLYDAGVITGEQRLDLTAPYVDQLNGQMQSTSNPDEKRDFLADLSATLDAAKRLRPGDTSSISYLEKVNNLANSLTAVSGAQHRTDGSSMG
jgi:hypothetical protein